MGKNWKKQTITGKWVASHPPIYKIRALAPLERRRAKQLGGTSFPAPDTAINRQIIVVSHSFINRLELITHHSRQFSSHSNDYRLVTSPWLWMLEGLRIQSWSVEEFEECCRVHVWPRRCLMFLYEWRLNTWSARGQWSQTSSTSPHSCLLLGCSLSQQTLGYSNTCMRSDGCIITNSKLQISRNYIWHPED